MRAASWALALGVVASAAAFGPVTSSETLLQSSFSSALAVSRTTGDKMPKTAPISGSEEFWLSQIQKDPGAPLAKTVAAGDKISMTFGGTARTFEVASVAEYAPNVTTTDTSSKAGKFVLVTAKDVGKPDARPIRFVIEVEAPTPAMVLASKPRTL